ncbi:ribonuclease H-like domain-containing protein [Tanacetum coccineum]
MDRMNKFSPNGEIIDDYRCALHDRHDHDRSQIDQGLGSTSGIRACALRNFDLEVMELENTQNNALAKLPMLKLGEYEMWEIRIKQYFQIQDYALWEVIENGNSWVPIPVTTPPESGTSTTTKMTVPATIEEKTCKKNDVKARSLLLMALPNEHQLTFDQYVDAQSMFAAIKARFGGNEATKKTQKALLKQQYENFSASSSESLDSIFNRLQKLVSRLAILGVVTPPEDLNVKFLRSLPSEWDTHVVVWMNKPDFDTMGLDDLYNNFKIVEQKVKKSAGASNDDKNLAFVTTSGASSTNNINTVNPEVSTATTKVNTASTEICTASFSDATVYAFLSTQPKGSQLVHEDLEQLHDDDLEEMDLKWNMALLSMRARKFYQRTGRKIIIDGSNTAGYDKSKVECFNCHKMGHFARECRAPRSKDNRNWNQGSSTKTVKIEDASEKAMCAIDGAGFDWSDMAEEEIQANMALMAFSDSEVKNDKSCSKNCLKNYEALKKQYDDLLVKLSDTDFKAATYKRGLATLEGQIVKYKEHEVLFSEEIALLKRSVAVIFISSSNNFGELLSLRPSKTITEASLRRHLKLEDHDGVTFLPNSEIFEQLALMGIKTDSNKLTFPRVFSHLIGGFSIHSLTSFVFSPKMTAWGEFKSLTWIGVLEDDLKKTKQTYSASFTKLILKIKKLESKVKTGKARKRARVKSKKLLEQERLGLEEAIRLHGNKVDIKEERAQRARDEEIARQLLALDENEVVKRYSSSKPEGYDLMLWGDLHTLFEPDEESEIWMNQNEYNLISWSLCDFCRVHILLMQNGIAIHMLTEKKYPLSQEMISKMLSKRLEVDQESTQAYELLKFIRSQVKK